jgi:energy-coupling factor transporter ATP-binding protein EcfA2
VTVAGRACRRPRCGRQGVWWGLDRLGLRDKRDLHPFQLSQGEKRRLSLEALMLAPARPLLVLDEPSFGLDAAGTASLMRQVAELRQSGRGVVLITHDMDLAAALCDRLAVMSREDCSRWIAAKRSSPMMPCSRRLGSGRRRRKFFRPGSMPAPLERSRLGRLNPLSKLTLAGAFLAASSLVFEPRFQLAAILAALLPLILLEGARPLELLWRLWPFALVGLGYLWLNLAFFDRAAAYT